MKWINISFLSIVPIFNRGLPIALSIQKLTFAPLSCRPFEGKGLDFGMITILSLV
jgi:hypothetical protein